MSYYDLTNYRNSSHLSGYRYCLRGEYTEVKNTDLVSMCVLTKVTEHHSQKQNCHCLHEWHRYQGHKQCKGMSKPILSTALW